MFLGEVMKVKKLNIIRLRRERTVDDEDLGVNQVMARRLDRTADESACYVNEARLRGLSTTKIGAIT